MQAGALTSATTGVKGETMTRPLTTLMLVAAAALAGCNKEDHTIVAGPDVDDQPMNNVGVVLPPSIQASKVYRCKDNSLVYIDWLSDGSARAKKDRNEVGTSIAAGDASLKGDAKAGTITYKGQSCKG
jgi:hypothetical protein